MDHGSPNTGEGGARRAAVLHEKSIVIDLIELTLNHGLFVVRAAGTLHEAEAIVAEWRPHMAVIDMDHDDSATFLQWMGSTNTLSRTATPVPGLTRRGDLRTKLRAFELGVDDILTTPFSPELLARSIVITRRASGMDRPIVPTIRLGEIEVDIVNRVVYAGDSVIHLSGIEQRLLYLLASRAGQVVLPDMDLRPGGVPAGGGDAHEVTRSWCPSPSPRAQPAFVISCAAAIRRSSCSRFRTVSRRQ